MGVNDEGGTSLPYTHLDITHLEVDVEGLDRLPQAGRP